jgi:hypothetical protein
MSFASAVSTLPASQPAPSMTFGTIYLHLLSPDGQGPEHLRQVLTAAAAPHARFPSGATSIEFALSRVLGQRVRLTEPQYAALRRLAGHPALAQLCPWALPAGHAELPEMAPASSLNELYLALLKPDGGMIKRFKAVQAATALYEPGVPGSQAALEQELSQLVHKPVRLSEPQLRCFKELLIDEPAFAHIAPWEDLTASW